MNLMTLAMEKLTSLVFASDLKLKDMGKEPYGTREATEKEQQEMFDNLTPEKLEYPVQTYGTEEVNKFIKKFDKEGRYG